MWLSGTRLGRLSVTLCSPTSAAHTSAVPNHIAAPRWTAGPPPCSPLSSAHMEPRVLCYLSHCGDGISDEKDFRKLGSVLAYSLRVQSTMTGKAWHQELEAVILHSQSGSREREECWLSWLSFYSAQDHIMWDGAHSQGPASQFSGKIPPAPPSVQGGGSAGKST